MIVRIGLALGHIQWETSSQAKGRPGLETALYRIGQIHRSAGMLVTLMIMESGNPSLG